MWSVLLLAAMSTADAKDRGGIGVSLAVEALSPFQEGFQAEAGLGFGKNRLTVGATWLERPPFYTPGQAFTEYRRHVDIHLTRFLLSKGQKGLNVGIGASFFYDVDVTNNDTQEELELGSFTRIQGRLGFVWFPLKKLGLYVEPAMVAGVALGSETINFTDLSSYNSGLLDISGPLVLVGWRFGMGK